jgi:hypothetical protein
MSTITSAARDGVAGHAPHEHRPLAAYAALSTTFGAAFVGALAAIRLSGRELPARPSAGDLLLAGVATHKVSRLVAKDKVTAFVRAPFTRFQESTGQGEVEEAPRGTGLRYAVGELLVCPYCLAQWVAAGFALGLVAAPRTTRLVAGVYAAETLSDFLQLAYKAAEDHA